MLVLGSLRRFNAELCSKSQLIDRLVGDCDVSQDKEILGKKSHIAYSVLFVRLRIKHSMSNKPCSQLVLGNSIDATQFQSDLASLAESFKAPNTECACTAFCSVLCARHS